jgi:hypothetical protein
MHSRRVAPAERLYSGSYYRDTAGQRIREDGTGAFHDSDRDRALFPVGTFPLCLSIVSPCLLAPVVPVAGGPLRSG